MANGIGELLDELELTLSSGSCEEMVVQQSVGEWRENDKWPERVTQSLRITQLLRQHQNATSLANRLPLEVLQDVFILLRGGEATFELPPSQDAPVSLLWIGVSHVCQHWRHAALSHKRLWCTIRLGARTWQAGTVSTTFLRRSCPLPITLYHKVGPLVDTEAILLHEFYTALERNPERIHRLFLSGTFNKRAPTTLRRLLSSAVELSLSFDPEEQRHVRRPRVNFIDELLGEPLFMLRKLHLSNCTWPINPFPSLTHLYLTHEDVVFDIDVDAFYAFLNGVSQHLQVLYLSNAAVYEDHDSLYLDLPAPADKIQMRALEHIEIIPPRENDDLTPVLSFLHRLSMSLRATIVWHASDIMLYLPNDIPWYTVPSPEHCDRVTEVICTSLREECFAIHGRTLYFSPNILGLRNGLQKFGRFFPNVRSVALPSQPQLSSIIDLAAVLPGFPAITSLHLQCPSNYAQVRVIHWLESRHKSTTICPNLVDLTFLAENDSVVGTRGGTSYVLGDMGLQFPEFPSDKAQVYDSVVRSRQQFGTTYTVRYPTGTDLDVLLVEVSP